MRDMEELFNAMMNGTSVECQNCKAVNFLSDEEMEAYKKGLCACGNCKGVLDVEA